MSKKKIYEVEEHETVSDCLERMNKDGYMPVKRIEKPVFQEKVEAGQVTYEPVGRKITFEARNVE
ncbi:NETI motif-containing protein [Niallia sp. XMNu-256]|uniref:NETI motif-containing protein n=1 Tax=Niallia sp. XMNu-256 TaxID=3082444 RepID=UPI0030CBBD00